MSLRLRLTAEVEYDQNGTDIEILKENLEECIRRAFEEGTLSGSTEATVTSTTVGVENADEAIILKWTEDDIVGIAVDMGYTEITQQQAIEILESVRRGHDADIGVNWDVIRANVSMYFNK